MSCLLTDRVRGGGCVCVCGGAALRRRDGVIHVGVGVNVEVKSVSK